MTLDPVPGRPAWRRGQHDRGTASVELVGLMPVVVAVVLCCVQLFAAVYAVMAADAAVRQAARAYSLGEDPGSAARQALPGGLELLSVDTFGPDYGVEVEVVVPSLDLLPQITVARRAEMP